MQESKKEEDRNEIKLFFRMDYSHRAVWPYDLLKKLYAYAHNLRGCNLMPQGLFLKHAPTAVAKELRSNKHYELNRRGEIVWIMQRKASWRLVPRNDGQFLTSCRMVLRWSVNKTKNTFIPDTTQFNYVYEGTRIWNRRSTLKQIMDPLLGLVIRVQQRRNLSESSHLWF
jgi:hypothetical protein